MIFKTKRLIIRKLTLKDFDGFFDLHSNERVMSMIPSKVLNCNESMNELKMRITHYSDTDSKITVWAVVEKNSNNFIGLCAIIKDEPGSEIGYRLREKHWNKGFGTEITEGLINFIFNYSDENLIFADVSKSNVASQKILQKFMTSVKETYNASDNCIDIQYQLKRGNYPDFEIKPTGRISLEFIKKDILTFSQASFFVRSLPYRRNENKADLITIFSDSCGTCSTKHALLKQLADENNFKGLQLIIGLFKMNGNNTPEISRTFKQYGLDFIPEAHCYLKFKNQIFDYTKVHSKSSDFIDDLIEEIEISPEQITDYKIAYHKKYLENWLTNNRQLNFTLNDLWAIREQCIQDLAAN